MVKKISITDRQYDQLAKQVALGSNAAIAAAIREGLDLWIAKQQEKDKKRSKPKRAFDGYIGAIKSKPLEPYMEIDDIYEIPPRVRTSPVRKSHKKK